MRGALRGQQLLSLFSMNKRIKSIEGCRGLAVIFVLATHFFVMFYPAEYWGPQYSHLANNLDYLLVQWLPIPSANSGVTLFLTITGFGTYMALENPRLDIRRFFVLRYFKLLALTLLGVLPVLLLLKAGWVWTGNIQNSINTPWLDGWPPKGMDVLHIILNNPLWDFRFYNNVLWTMPFFFWGSFLAFILHQIYTDSLRSNILASMAALLILANVGKFFYMPCVFGCLLAYCYKHRPVLFHASAARRAGLFLLALYMCSYPTGTVGSEGIYCPHGLAQAYVIYHTIGASLLAALVLMEGSILGKAMDTRAFQWLGKYSMGIYVIHYSLLVSIIAWGYSIMPPGWPYPARTLPLFIVYVICLMMASVPVQALSGVIFSLLDKAYCRIFAKRFNVTGKEVVHGQNKKP